jgi:hypothetical protein
MATSRQQFNVTLPVGAENSVMSCDLAVLV